MLPARLRDQPLWFALAAIALLGALLVWWPFPREAGAIERPAHRITVADIRGQALLIVDTASGAVVQRVELPGGPHELLELPDGRIVASLEQSGILAVIDLDSGGVVAVGVGGTPHGMAIDGEVLIVTDRATNEMRRFDLESWDEATPVATGGWPHAVAVLPDGRVAVAAAADSTLMLGEQEIDVSELPETVAVDPEGGHVATAGALGGALEVVDLEGEPVLDVWLGGRPVRVAFAPNGESLAVALSAAHEVALVGLDASVRRVAVSGVPDGLAFSEDGRWLYASDVYAGALTQIDVASGVATATFQIGESTGALVIR